MDTEMTEASVEPTVATPDQNALSPTLYIRNLNESIKLEVLKKSLRTIFGQYGEILDIVAHKNIRMRGQAFVAFDSTDTATKAMNEVQSFPLYGKPMTIQYAKNKSDIHAKRDGEFEEHKAKRLVRKEQFAKDFKPRKKTSRQKQAALEQQQQQQQQQGMAYPGMAPYPGAMGMPGYGMPPAPGVPGGALPPVGITAPAASAGPAAVPMIPDEFLPRNNILFVQNLPDDVVESQLVELFSRYPGFKEVRMVPGKKGIAFVEYDNEYVSETAKNALADYSISEDNKMKVTFARK
ncbi:hypothetical protein DFQ27_003634 [Actinomortierella ambigua]|uniref:RRM domain-containing protein n=1 Tax=Actinomortierella ambigua TaxID=1343610 RepID=A0A9P6Q476_9FUNG|nr:hypothetical protein DFQ27_003634 [Actinomortierella ambigua]